MMALRWKSGSPPQSAALPTEIGKSYAINNMIWRFYAGRITSISYCINLVFGKKALGFHKRNFIEMKG
jgi:hypothetical protein